jgi:serine protease Do
LIAFTDTLSQALDDLVERVRSSLVVVQAPGKRHFRRFQQGGIGAGVVWRQGGLVITNRHVLTHDRVTLLLPDGEEKETRLVHQDARLDLALLQVESEALPPALIADSHSLRIGQLVFAVGHPWGQRGLVTQGVIHGLSKVGGFGRNMRNSPGKPVDGLEIESGEIEIIRSDVQLAPGNSGGPLVNAAGAVVGINTMIIGGDQGVAISSNVVEAFIDGVLREHRQPAPTMVLRAG